ncbi:MAG: virulence RhuM family protein, partial [Prevotellaceae bacterium]|nr:virulence RhuM family protein [Prevotellaceae bacterium]
MNELVNYTAEGLKNFQVRIDEDTVWLTQAQMVELFGRDKSVISRHIKNIFKEGELQLASTVANFATVQNESGREVVRNVEHYSLDVIISVGYRVKSQRGVQFRIWATSVLRAHLLKGYTIKQPVTLEHLQEMKQNLACQIEELRQQIENLDI